MTTIIYDEAGPVLISHPLSFQKKEGCDPPKIWLFHLSSFYSRRGVRAVVIEPAVKDKKARILKTYPSNRFSKPNNKYANRCLLLLGNIVLVYCHQRLDKPDQDPQLWILELK
ncbi:unnamed protein product [Gongylonema pulchrum]|uniref:Transposase n=1 Tax=Gongylonema pulchrum TaxID=637853 RepID=A0A183DW34_9BILA|nr:unnamed protein product [Gongylonema pulchrum]